VQEVQPASRAAPDGYQFVFGDSGTFAANQSLYKKLPYNPTTDFAPVILVTKQSMVLLVRKDFPASNLQQFITYAKTYQDSMHYGSPGTGSPPHLACALLNAKAGISVTHVPYRGNALALQDLIAGRLDYQCVGTATSASQIESNMVKAIALLTTSRSPILPALASAHEQGLIDFDADAWGAFFIPERTPRSIVQRLNVATAMAMDTPFIQDRLKEVGVALAMPEQRSPEYLKEFVATEIRRWAAAISSAGISAE
jgi:tripartite-type tricarboxylate transporter receptor subunit TctC